LYRDGVRKAKAHLELNQVRQAEGSRKCFYRSISSNRKIRGNVGPLRSAVGVLVTKDTEKPKVLHATFSSVFTRKTTLQESQASETRGQVWSKEYLPLVEEDQVREHLNKVSPWDLMGGSHGC